MPLRPYFWIPLIIFLVGGAIGLEVALHFSNKNQGWPSKQTDGGFTALHYVYTFPPVIIAAVVVALWTWTDVEIKKIQPYVDLVHGDSPPHRSLLLDYTRHNNFLVWTHAASNRHYLVALASLMVILSLSFQPLAAALLVVKDTWMQAPDITLKNLAAIGLNQNLQFSDLTSFLTGAGYAGASILYGLPSPAFIQVPYTVANFELPVNVTNNGTAFVNTTAIKSKTGCNAVPVQMTNTAPGAWLNTASLDGCSITWNCSNATTKTLFGAETPNCTFAPLPEFSPVVFWFFSYDISARANATFCSPSIELWEVNVGVDISTGNVTKVSDIRPFSQDSKFSSFSANVTGAPLNGRAYNGIKFNLTGHDSDQFILGRQSATQLQLPASIYQAAVKSPQGYAGSFDISSFGTLSDKVYGIYLALVAREVYFIPDNEDINVQVKTFQKRVWLSDVPVHLLATAMSILAFFATIVHIFHMEDRRYLRLKHEPGTIASAVSIGAKTGVGEVLAGRQGGSDIKEALRNRRFRIDPVSMKIVMEGEYGYETAASPTSPTSKRKSILEILQGQRGAGQALTKSPPGTNAPPSPKTPRTPSNPPVHDWFAFELSSH
ncbi:hypothetical protein GALMADRAFT_142353 [Galerina marginata CBS 339.88]|uniref:Uncharacterized protein n=1 Tax=Galerina marginata (strain CBS 339.88) TaxID=685588 RepID=A0A067SQI2_GALM3|nr:hypothetical protein GALMADRAFT_142353 [Galerina marginata CBS 339.88]